MPSTDSRPCPRCKGSMVHKPVKLITLDECPACKGLWFDGGEFDRAFRILTGSYSDACTQKALIAGGSVPVEAGDRLDCPACSCPMDARNLKETKLVVDTCPRCAGLWLDRDELDTLKGLTDSKRPRLGQDVLDDIRRNPSPSAGVKFLGDLAGEMLAPSPLRRRWTGHDAVDLLLDVISDD